MICITILFSCIIHSLKVIILLKKQVHKASQKFILVLQCLCKMLLSVNISYHTIVVGYYGSRWTSFSWSVIGPSICISFPDDNLSVHHLILTKLAMCIDIVEIWFGIANGHISSNFDGVLCPRHAHIFVSVYG